MGAPVNGLNAVAETASETSMTVTVLLAIIGSSLIGTVVTLTWNGVRTAAGVRRDRYAEAVVTLVAWREMPYRIRRRTSDSPEVLAALSNAVHDLQEASARSEAWVRTDDATLGWLFIDARQRINAVIEGGALRDAWLSQAVTTPAGMNLNIGPQSVGDAQRKALAAFSAAVQFRFGWRRLLPDRAARRAYRRASS